MTRRSQYVDKHVHEGQEGTRLRVKPGDAKYLFVYPFVKTRAWYLLPLEERQAIMDVHIKVGHEFPTRPDQHGVLVRPGRPGVRGRVRERLAVRLPGSGDEAPRDAVQRVHPARHPDLHLHRDDARPTRWTRWPPPRAGLPPSEVTELAGGAREASAPSASGRALASCIAHCRRRAGLHAAGPARRQEAETGRCQLARPSPATPLTASSCSAARAASPATSAQGVQGATGTIGPNLNGIGDPSKRPTAGRWRHQHARAHPRVDHRPAEAEARHDDAEPRALR